VIEAYLIIGIMVFFGGVLTTLINMIDYYDEKKSRHPRQKDLDNSRKFVRISFTAMLLAPVWPIIFPILVILGFIKVARVVMEID
jgi:hypothetical protein